MAQPLSFRWEPEFIAQIDAARGDVPRSTFVKRAVEAALRDDKPETLSEALDRVPELAEKHGVSRSVLRRELTTAACPECHSLGGHQRGCKRA